MGTHEFKVADGGIWAAIHTPFLADGSLDLQGIRRNVTVYTQALGLRGVFFCGLTDTEHDALLADLHNAGLTGARTHEAINVPTLSPVGR